MFLGAPGVGKGTQAERISSQYAIQKISTGDLLREAVRNGTRLGLEAKSYMDQGRLVPDTVVIGLVKEKLAGPSCANGFVLDGFPRTVPQAEELDKVLTEQRLKLNRVINFQVDRGEIVKRLGGRRNCPQCQATFHVDYAPSRKGTQCDRCDEVLVQRSDDKEEAIKTRLQVYEEQTAPLINFYKKQNLLSDLVSVGTIDLVFENLTKVLTANNFA